MRSTYLITVATGEKCTSEEEYAIEAGKLIILLQSLFQDPKHYKVWLKAEPQSMAVEAEVTHSENGVLGTCAVDIDAERKVYIDKTKLSNEVKSLAPAWPFVKITKQAAI